jgi:serine protease Do
MRSNASSGFLRNRVLGWLAAGGLSAGGAFAADLPAVPLPVDGSPALSASVSAPGGVSPRRDEFVAVVDRVKGAVVNIHSEKTVLQPPDDPFQMGAIPLRAKASPQRVNGMGTGIVLDPRGYIVTNYHVIEDVSALRVRLVDGTNCTARVVATDKETDLALVKIDPPKPLPTVPFGTAQDLMLAETVVAIGNAFGYEHTVTVGRVSAMNRDVTLNKEISYKSLIQTQTPINPGNSGGPLFNKLGEVVGVNVAIRAGAQNIAFAIPVDTMLAKAAEMLGGRRRASVRAGLVAADKFDRAGEDGHLRRWMQVQRVDGGAAAEAGLKADDVIETVGDLTVHSSLDFERGMLDRAAGEKVRLRVRRGGQLLDVNLPVAGDRPAVTATADDALWYKIGVKAMPVGANLVTVADKQLRGGLWLSEVGAGTPAARAGLAKGDILVGLHQWETLSLDNVAFVMGHKDLATFSPLTAYFVRDGKVRTSPLKLGE